MVSCSSGALVPADIPAMILAAGRGQRMRPLTDVIPKPLLPVRGKPLMQWPMEALAASGFVRQVVNTAWLGEQIPAYFQRLCDPAASPVAPAPADGDTLPPAPSAPILLAGRAVDLSYSHEEQDFGYALETAGGIVRALPLLGEVFWALAGDVYAPGFAFSPASVQRFIASGLLAHLWLVANPEHNPKGDFGLSPPGPDGLCRALNIAADSGPRYTFSTIALYRRELFGLPWCSIWAGNPQGSSAPLAPLLRAAMDAGLVSAEIYPGAWTDVGTPERLAALNDAP